MPEITCLNCDTKYEGKRCPECGQRASVGRLTLKQVFAEVPRAILDFQGRYWETIRDIVVNPGKMVKAYSAGKRKYYVSPIQFYFFFATIGLLMNEIVVVDYEPLQVGVENSSGSLDPQIAEAMQMEALEIVKWVTIDNQHYFSLGYPLFLGLILTIFFRKVFNLAESLTFSFYTLAICTQVIPLFTDLIPLDGWTQPLQMISLVGFTAYAFYTIGTRRVVNMLLGLVSIVVATFLYFGLTLIVILLYIMNKYGLLFS